MSGMGPAIAEREKNNVIQMMEEDDTHRQVVAYLSEGSHDEGVVFSGSGKAPLRCGRGSPYGLCSLRGGCRKCEEGVPVFGVIK